MQVWSAIDVRGGKCVRLQQGDYDRETVFGADPAAMAQYWVEQGARRLHLVDLDGARDGRQANLASVQAILAAVDVPCQLGGGVRDEAVIRQLLELGLRQLVVGTRALREPDWFRDVCRRFPKRLVLGIDARNGLVATDGWRQTSDVPAIDLARELASEPLAAIVYTDITTDGMLKGPNFAAIAQMRDAVSVPVIASGGVTTAADVQRLADLGLGGCIIGRALYEKTITLGEALAAAREEGSGFRVQGSGPLA